MTGFFACFVRLILPHSAFFILYSAFLFQPWHASCYSCIPQRERWRIKNTNVLVCDDDPATCELIAAILSDAGYEVQQEYDGTRALNTLKHGKHQIMILDYMLGETNGLDILQKACQLDHEVRIIMISGYQSLADPAAYFADLPTPAIAGFAKAGVASATKEGYQAPPERYAQASAGQADDLPKRAKELGASGFLSKPFLIQELLNLVGKKRRS
ncbi:MAG: response regulator [Kiritimatiellae bacterium]|nr:response regulator [Kiritimatiellia bacterium]